MPSFAPAEICGTRRLGLAKVRTLDYCEQILPGYCIGPLPADKATICDDKRFSDIRIAAFGDTTPQKGIIFVPRQKRTIADFPTNAESLDILLVLAEVI